MLPSNDNNNSNRIASFVDWFEVMLDEKDISLSIELPLKNNIGSKYSNCCLLINDFSPVTSDYHLSLSELCRDQSLLRAPTLNRINESSPLEFFFPSLSQRRRWWLQTSHIRRSGQLPHQRQIERFLCVACTEEERKRCANSLDGQVQSALFACLSKHSMKYLVDVKDYLERIYHCWKAVERCN